MALFSKTSFLVIPLVLLISCGGNTSNTPQNAAGAGEQQQSGQAAQASQNAQNAHQTLSSAQDPARSIPDFTFYVLKSGSASKNPILDPGTSRSLSFLTPVVPFASTKQPTSAKTWIN